MKTLEIDLAAQTSRMYPVSAENRWLGGRALIARTLLDRLVPDREPLSPDSPMVIAPGLLAGIRFSSLDRISIGGRSPLTGGIKESNAGGSTAMIIAQMGLQAIVLTGMHAPGWCIVRIQPDKVTFEPAAEWTGLGVYDGAERLKVRYGARCAMLIIGPAGERQSLAAGVQNLDKEGSPSRICARGGLGALMGSKQVKAIVFDPGERPRMAFADSERVAALQKIYNQTLLQDAFVKTLTTLGTAGNTLVDDMVGALPTRNFSSGSFEGAEAISGEELLGRIRRRKGNPSHACMAGCIIRCSNSLPDEDGSLLVSPLDFETIAMLGSNLGIDDLDLIAQINYELNDLGLDTIEMGAALGVAADGGVWKFGDQQRLKEIVAEIRAGTPLGRLLANGAYQTGIALGVERIPVVKRQAMAAYDPRVLQVTGITYATSAQGADHTAGMTLRAASKNQTPEDLARISRRLQVENAALDAIGACLFAGSGFKADPQFLPALVEAVFGEAVESDFFHDLGEKTLSWEWEYNQKVGFSRADDRIPGWMQTEPLPPTGRVFDLPGAVLDSLNG